MPEYVLTPIESEALYKERLENVRKRTGKEILNDDDIFVLVCEELLHTYTYKEKGYC